MKKFYLPVLKAKGAEFRALKFLTPWQRASMLPLFEIPPVAMDFSTHKPKETLEAHIRGTLEKLKKVWDAPAFVDLPYVSSLETIRSAHPLAEVISEAERIGLHLIPVISTDPLRGAKHQLEVARLVQSGSRRVCVRIHNEITPSELPVLLDAILTMLNIEPPSVDLIFDLGRMEEQLIHYAFRMKAYVQRLPSRGTWNSISLVGSGLPASVSGMAKFVVNTVPRTEWILWNKLRTDPDCKNLFCFGDYTVSAPGTVYFDPRVMKMNAKIWYTSKDDWMLTPGSNWKDDTAQYGRLCQLLIADPHFMGEGYSVADERIVQCARGEIKGSPQTWLQDGIVHHVTHVLEELARLGGS